MNEMSVPKKLPGEGTLLRAVYDALAEGPASVRTINARLPKEHRKIQANRLSPICQDLARRGLVHGKSPKGYMKMYAWVEHEFPPVSQFVTVLERRRGARW